MKKPKYWRMAMIEDRKRKNNKQQEDSHGRNPNS
jgi:hypothetical protein